MLMWFNTFASINENTIIDHWLSQLESEFPNNFDHVRLRNNGVVVYKLITDIQTPLEQCPLYENLPKISEYHANRGTHIEQMIRSFHIWRKSISSCLRLWTTNHSEFITATHIWDTVPRIHERIDEMQKVVCRMYWEFAQNLIQQKDHTISQLHNDRLNMLGKMAASMAHELRNPLFAIEGFLKLIRLKLPLEALQKVEKYITVMENEFNGLYHQISGILSFSKNNAFEESHIPCSTQEITQNAINLVGPRLINDSIEIKLCESKDFNIIVQKIAIQQVLINLINNSIEAFEHFTSQKKVITISAWEDVNLYYIAVMDNGPGVPEEIKETIFEPFVTGKDRGTGLGLSICAQIMKKNNGVLSLSSQEGNTVFTLSFPKTVQAASCL